jgi:hypothetical protein
MISVALAARVGRRFIRDFQTHENKGLGPEVMSSSITRGFPKSGSFTCLLAVRRSLLACIYSSHPIYACFTTRARKQMQSNCGDPRPLERSLGKWNCSTAGSFFIKSSHGTPEIALTTLKLGW